MSSMDSERRSYVIWAIESCRRSSKDVLGDPYAKCGEADGGKTWRTYCEFETSIRLMLSEPLLNVTAPLLKPYKCWNQSELIDSENFYQRQYTYL